MTLVKDLTFNVQLFRKALDDEELLPHNVVHQKKKFTFRLTEEQKVTLDI